MNTCVSFILDISSSYFYYIICHITPRFVHHDRLYKTLAIIRHSSPPQHKLRVKGVACVLGFTKLTIFVCLDMALQER